MAGLWPKVRPRQALLQSWCRKLIRSFRTLWPARPPRAASGVTASASCPNQLLLPRRPRPIDEEPHCRSVNKPRTTRAADVAMIADRAADASSYVLGRFLRTREKYITAKAASNTPPTIKIKVVTIAQFSSAGPYNLRPRSYGRERCLALGFCRYPCPMPAARKLAPPWTTSIPSVSSSTTPLTKRARLFLPQQRAAPLLGQGGVCSSPEKSPPPAHDLQRRSRWPASAPSLGSWTAGSKAHHLRHVFRTIANLTPARLSC